MHLLLQVSWNMGKQEAAILREDNRFLVALAIF
jgi:hypothetical protein